MNKLQTRAKNFYKFFIGNIKGVTFFLKYQEVL
jgi:hypothetical protein